MLDQFISGGAGLVGGIIGANAARGSQRAQERAINEALGIVDKTMVGMNDRVADATTAAQQGVSSAAEGGAQAVLTAGQHAGDRVIGAANDANALLDPYAQFGVESVQGLRELLLGSQAPTAETLPMDPGYQFRLKEGEKLLARSAAARGSLMSGGFAKALNNYAQESASQEFAKAYDRYETTAARRQQGLTNAMGLGYSAASRQGSNTLGAQQYAGDMNFAGERTAAGYRLGAAEYSGNTGINSVNTQNQNLWYGSDRKTDLITQRGNVQAAGITARGNAYAGIFNNIANTVNNGIAARQRPTTTSSPAAADYSDIYGWDN